MADEVDRANERAELDLASAIRAARAPVPVGVPGECISCGDDFPRLIGGRCGYCRDGRRKGARRAI